VAEATIAERLRWQAGLCATLGSTLYQSLLARAADDVDGGGPLAAVLEGHEQDRIESMLGLRLMAGVHRLVLEGAAPPLARFYPSAGGTPELDPAWQAFAELARTARARLRELLERPCQTNEVGRSAALVGGFLSLVGQTGLPLRLLEIGSSAGLNLQFDRYLYACGGSMFGDPRSPVRFEDVFAERCPPLEQRPVIAERRGCDPRPLDPASADDRLTLLSAVWADQTERVAQLRAALELAAAAPSPVERAQAGEWLEGRLGDPHDGAATVVFHSIVWQYLGEREAARVARAIERAGERATAESPLAWLRMEPGGELAEVRLTTWPGGDESVIAQAGYHGRPVLWRA
jgi:hypothetical protein